LIEKVWLSLIEQPESLTKILDVIIVSKYVWGYPW